MHNCSTCGVPLQDGDAFCPNCGTETGLPKIQPVAQAEVVSSSQVLQQPKMQAPVVPVAQPTSVPVTTVQDNYAFQDDWKVRTYEQNRAKNRSYASAIKVFMVLACVASITAYFIPLLWMVPMTIVAFKKLDREEPLGIGFKICTLLFVTKIGGIIMLLMKDDVPQYT